MEQYIIGAGAMLSTGSQASIIPAALHAQVDPALAACAQAVAIDFEGTSPQTMRRFLLVARGWNARQFEQGVTARLLERGDCSLADVLEMLAGATGASEVHLFAHWLPDDATCEALGSAGVTLVVHPIEAIDQAALIAEQRHVRWNAGRAA
ncbi:MAG: hypothetical protein ACXVAW_01635 [Vulcanimicrobiaceae bacterium]